MKTYRELYFRGAEKQLSEFVNEIGNYVKGEWTLRKQDDYHKQYLWIDYTGQNVNKAMVSIYFGGDNLSRGELMVGNIVPLEKSELSVNEYNDVLMLFYNDIIKPFKESGTSLEISQPTDDIFDPLTEISEESLKKLKAFCRSANKSTGSSHPNDQERWFEFIYQTVVDDRMIGYDTLANFLQDEAYWGKKPDESSGVMGNHAWDEKNAYELASEYESLTTFLSFCKTKKGIL